MSESNITPSHDVFEHLKTVHTRLLSKLSLNSAVAFASFDEDLQQLLLHHKVSESLFSEIYSLASYTALFKAISEIEQTLVSSMKTTA